MGKRMRHLLAVTVNLVIIGLETLSHAAPLAEIVIDAGKPLGDAGAVTDFLGAGGALESVLDDPNSPTIKAWTDLGFRHFYLESVGSKEERPPLVEPSRSADGRLTFDFSQFDKRIQQIVKTLKARPHIYLGHVPRALSSRPNDPSYSVYSPKSLREWSDYAAQIAGRLAGNHGLKGLYYHCLGEPDHHDSWKGSGSTDARQLLKEHVALYAATYSGVKSADPTALVGGPATMNWQKTKWTQEAPFELRDWIAALARHNAALPAERRVGLDFIAWQDYAWSSDRLSDGADAVSKMLAEHGFDSNTPKVLGGSGWGSWSSDYIAEELKPHHRASHLIHNIIREFKEPSQRRFRRALYYAFFFDDASLVGEPKWHYDQTQVRRVSLVRFRWDEKPFLTPLYAGFQLASAIASGKIVKASAPEPLEAMAVSHSDGSVIAVVNNHTNEGVAASAVFKNLPFETPKLHRAMRSIDESAADYGRGLQDALWEEMALQGRSVRIPLVVPAFGTVQIQLWPAYPQKEAQ